MAPRSLWNGTVSVGLVHVPVKLYSATESKIIHFHEVHLSDGGRIERRRFCEKEEREVPYEEVVRDFEVGRGSYVALEKDEAKAAAGGTAHLIEVEHFVPVEDIDPVYYDRSYYLGAGEKAKDGYRVLHDALERTGRAAIGRFTFHNREYLAAIRPLDGVLALHTLHFADEVVERDDFDYSKPPSSASHPTTICRSTPHRAPSSRCDPIPARSGSISADRSVLTVDDHQDVCSTAHPARFPATSLCSPPAESAPLLFEAEAIAPSSLACRRKQKWCPPTARGALRACAGRA